VTQLLAGIAGALGQKGVSGYEPPRSRLAAELAGAGGETAAERRAHIMSIDDGDVEVI
jgi:hypothetical protein